MYDMQAAIIILLCNLTCALICMQLLAKKNWSPVAGFMIGLTFGVLGILLAYSLPTIFDLNKAAATTAVPSKWATCVFCDTQFAAERLSCPYCDTHLQTAPSSIHKAAL